jgi:subtilase family serine protease
LHRITPWRVALAALGLLALAPAAQAAQSSARVTLGDSAPSWATPSAQVGSVPNDAQRHFWVYLRLRDGAALDSAVAAVSNPTSASYGRYLTPAQFRARYAPTDAQVASVRSWLKSAGFSVSSTSPANNRWIEVTGTTAQVERAFATQLRAYKQRDHVLAAPNADLSVPRSVSGLIAGVAGLDGGDRLMKPAGDIPDAPPAPAFVNAPPCSAYWGEKLATGDKSPDGQTIPAAYGGQQPYAPCGYTPSQLEGAYGVKSAIGSGLDGRGQTVAIVDAFASPTIEQDANQYATTHGQPPVPFSQILPPDVSNDPDEIENCDPQGWYGEESLDVEAVHAMAPGAHVLYVGGEDCFDENLIAAVNKIVDGNLAQIITNSYGNYGEDEDAALLQAWTDTFRQAALEGIGVYFSSGDNGDEIANIGFAATDFPASHPLVTAVGGTSLGVGKDDNYLFQTGWGTTSTTLTSGAWAPVPPGDHLYGAGGGTSRLFAEPDYQKPVVPKKLANANHGKGGGRVVPDVSLVGDPQTGMLVGQTQTFPDGTVKYSEYRLGGTSLSSPLMAGVMALADQRAGGRHGFANPALYGRYATTAYRDVVAPLAPIAVVRNDFVNTVDPSEGTTTKLRTFDQTGTLHTTAGYDDVTGVGTPNGQQFLDALAFQAGR